MGLLEKILTMGPGGPASAAKAVFRAYNTFLATNPESREIEALRFAIESRYQVINALSEGQIEICLKVATSLGDLIILILFLENPVAFSQYYVEETIDALEKFFVRNAPDELNALERIDTTISFYQAYAANEL